MESAGTSTGGGEPRALSDAIARLAALKAEHGPLLLAIAADPGMAADTRQRLIGHLVEEEDQAMRRIQASGRAGAPAEPARALPSVGSLRREPDYSAWPGASVGSLRPASS